MLKHVVMWKIKDDESQDQNKTENMNKLKEMLGSLKEKIPEIMEIEAGININPLDAAFDVALYSVFEDENALSIYQKHPEHLKVGDFLASIAEQRVVVDYLV